MTEFASSIVASNYAAPISAPRKGWRRRIEVFSPKISRRVCLESHHAYQTWLMIEANPSIDSFCERPALLPGSRPSLIDFWVRYKDRSAGEFWVIQRPRNSTLNTFPDNEYPSRAHSLPLRQISPTDLERNALPITNWGKIVPFIVANSRWRDPLLEQSLIVFLGHWHSIQSILDRFADRDPSELKAALFTLLSEGRLTNADLALKPLSLSTQFRRA